MTEDLESSRDHATTGSDARIYSAPRHTPGPWTVFYATGGRVVIGVGEANGAGITDRGFGTWRDGDEQEANAHLIAAAPDLAEALDWLLGCSAGARFIGPDREDRHDRFILARSAARTALAKALLADGSPLATKTGNSGIRTK